MRLQISSAARSVTLREFLPAHRNDDDLFVVEFPKSGVTWLTFLMANIHALLNDDSRAVTFFNINDFVPDIHSVRYVDAPRWPLPGFRCFKSHSRYLREYRKVFYLVRDPRHVMASYWVFLKGLGLWHGTPDKFVTNRQHGIHQWIAHVNGWLDGIDAAASFTLIRYEDLVSDTAGELKRLYKLLGMPVTEALIATAIDRSSIHRMRELESEFAARHPALRNLEFVRRKPAGGTREPLPASVIRAIEIAAGPLMERLGYRSGGAAEAISTSI
jgi:Sulfotransferase domain